MRGRREKSKKDGRTASFFFGSYLETHTLHLTPVPTNIAEVPTR